jgi:hypothetical protein
MEPDARVNAYFGLLNEHRARLNREIDLVMEGQIGITEIIATVARTFSSRCLIRRLLVKKAQTESSRYHHHACHYLASLLIQMKSAVRLSSS